MSLINQMLQDLEQRSSGNLLGSGIHGQVRAVPERGGMHTAWWLVLLLTLLLVGVCSWLWLRTPPPPAMPPELELRLAPGLSALPSPVAHAPMALDPVPSAKPDRQPISENMPAVSPPQSVQHEEAAIEAPVMDKTTTVAPTKLPKIEQPQVASVSSSSESMPKLDKQIKELTPQQRAENAYRAAGSALQQGRQAEAVADLEQALQLDSQHAAARQMLVGLLLQGKRTDEALRIAQEGVSSDPTQIGLAMILARVQVEQGNLHPALDTLDRSLPYAIDRADYQAFLAALLQRDKRNKEAIDHYVVALGKAPQNGVWWVGLGISLQAENRLPEAKEAFTRAKTTNSLTPDLEAFVNQKLAQLK